MGALVLSGWACNPAQAHAQIGAGITLQSDYRYRGRSVSDERPTATLNLAYDHRSGAYAGGNLTVGKPRGEGVELLRRVAYAGYVVKPKGGTALDLGVSNYHVTEYRGRRMTFDFNEVYAGAATDHLSLRLNYAPDYYQSGTKTLYADLSGTIRPRPSLRLFAHAGVLARIGGRPNVRLRRERYDLSLGVAKQFADCEISATWTRVEPPVELPGGGREKRDGLVLAASIAF